MCCYPPLSWVQATSGRGGQGIFLDVVCPSSFTPVTGGGPAIAGALATGELAAHAGEEPEESAVGALGGGAALAALAAIRRGTGKPQPLGCAALEWVSAAELANYEFPPADQQILNIIRDREDLW